MTEICGINDTSELATDRNYTAVDELGRDQVFVCMAYD